jgi:hypothetical protein
MVVVYSVAKKAILPLIIRGNIMQKEKPLGYKNTQLWYLYRQIFYGFSEYIDWDSRCLASVKAQNKYNELGYEGSLRQRRWREQPEFDGRARLNGNFLLEHIFTGNMFRSMISEIPVHNLTTEIVREIIGENYYVAWILRTEDKLLKGKRGKTIDDALKFYNNKGIEFAD